jgi:hypothetical protein
MPSDIYNTGASNVTNAYNTGKDAIGSFNPNDWQQQTQSGYNNLWNSQNSTQNDYISGFKNQILNQPSATSLYNKGNEMFNVQPLQDTANQLNNAVITAPQSNLDAAKGFNYDENQVMQKTSQDLQRLSPLAIAAQNNAQTAQGNALDYVNQGMAQNQYELQPTQEQGQYLMDSYARQQSGFTTTQQSQLDSLKAKMQAGVQLSSDEMAAFTSLTQAESSYQASLNAANAQVKAAQIGQQYQTVSPGQNLVNTFKNTIMNPSMLTSRTGVAKYG